MRVVIQIIGFYTPSEIRSQIGRLFEKHDFYQHIAVVFSGEQSHGFVRDDMPFLAITYSLAEGANLARILKLNGYSVVENWSAVFSAALYTGTEILEDIARVVDVGALKKIRQDFSRGIVTDAYVCLRGLSAKQQKRIKGWKLKPSDIAGPKIALSETVQGSRFAARKRVIRWEQMAQALMDM